MACCLLSSLVLPNATRQARLEAVACTTHAFTSSPYGRTGYKAKVV
jgi:hypothetical protein